MPLAHDAAWQHYDLSKSGEVNSVPPAADEACLWLVSTDFRFATASNVAQWLTVAERRRARHHPRSAIGRRFGIARATLRLVLSQMFDCAPGGIELNDGPFERVTVTRRENGGTLGIDVAYAGIWIVIAVAACEVGVGLSVAPVDEPCTAGDAFWNEAAKLSRARLDMAHAGAPTEHHAMTLPMPGGVCGVVTLDRRIEKVNAFGWTRPAKQVGKAALA